MPVGDDTYAYRGRLPHLSRPDRTYFVTFCTVRRQILPPPARTIVLSSCVYDHGCLAWIDRVVVMPDHVHLIAMPYETTSIDTVLERMKGASSHRVNTVLGRTGTLWQRESFDRIVRSGDNLDKKRTYIFENPVRKGLVTHWEDYTWIWASAR